VTTHFPGLVQSGRLKLVLLVQTFNIFIILLFFKPYHSNLIVHTRLGRICNQITVAWLQKRDICSKFSDNAMYFGVPLIQCMHFIVYIFTWSLYI